MSLLSDLYRRDYASDTLISRSQVVGGKTRRVFCSNLYTKSRRGFLVLTPFFGEAAIMELFAGATGCSDPSIARLYLERAGNDVTRAVNHFFDSPPGALEETDVIEARTSGGAGSASSSRLSSKRQRVSQKVPRQELLAFQSSRTAGKAALSPGIQQNCGESRDVSSKPERSAAGSAGGCGLLSATKPSAQWEEVALGCQR